jgi:hypothetical protein
VLKKRIKAAQEAYQKGEKPKSLEEEEDEELDNVE